MTKRSTKDGVRKGRSHKDWRNPGYKHGYCVDNGKCTLRASTYRVWVRLRGKPLGVSKHWEKFENFLADMGPAPKPGMSIIRDNPKHPYDKFNCRWGKYIHRPPAAKDTKYTFDGYTKTLKEWANLLGTNSSAMWKRLKRTGSPLIKGQQLAHLGVVGGIGVTLSSVSLTPTAGTNDSESTRCAGLQGEE